MRIWKLRLLIILPILSLVVFFIDYLIFHDIRDIENWIINSLGFVFIEVLLVIVVLQELLERRERASRLSKLNNLIGLFFSETGLMLLDKFLRINRTVRCESCFVATTSWSARDFDAAVQNVKTIDTTIKPTPDELSDIKNALVLKRDFLVRMMESPNLFEHERFTDLMQAILHLDEELEHRTDLRTVPPSDLAHLSNDTLRAFRLLLVEWLEHMKYLSVAYPYLYSLAVRINPLNPHSDPVVRE
jgi:hypothetical protein